MENKLPHEINRNESVIAIKNLYKSFGELHVLKGINFNVFKGENVVVLGKSGTGKSVLIKIMGGLLKADSGEINILGKDLNLINEKELDALRLRIGFSFQSS